MAKKLEVTTPVTVDGVNLKYDDDKQVVYKKTILELGARKSLESLNAKLPNQLKASFKVIDVADVPTGASNDELMKKLDDLENRKKNNVLLDRIAELELELAQSEAQKEAKQSVAGIPPVSPVPPTPFGAADAKQTEAKQADAKSTTQKP